MPRSVKTALACLLFTISGFHTAAMAQAPTRTTSTYEDWTLRCETPQGSTQKSCEVFQAQQPQGQTSPVSQVAIGRTFKTDPLKIVVQVPVNVWLGTGPRLFWDDRQPAIALTFRRCVPGGCFADAELSNEIPRKIRGRPDPGRIEYKDALQRNVEVPVTFIGFKRALDALLGNDQIFIPSPAPPEKTLTAERVSPPTPYFSPYGKRTALVIGQSNYRYTSALDNPANDAKDVAATLIRLGFSVIEGINLTRREFDDKIREFSRNLMNADVSLFFYAGHGIQVAGKNYLIPVDAKLEQPGDLALDAIDVGVIMAQMEAEKRVNIIILDACRDNPLARSLARSFGTRSSTVGQGLTAIPGAIGTLIAFATQPDNVALDGSGRNSPFTAALLKHLPTPRLDIGTVMRRVRADVIVSTKERQVPWDHSSLIGEISLAP